jgi:hypothetical protein
MSREERIAAEPEAQQLLASRGPAGRVREVLRQPGQPLETRRRTALESRFGHDFSGVRLHADGGAADSARELRAAAYTVGEHVVVDPHRASGRGIDGVLDHELTHVVQQRTGIVPAGTLQRLPNDRPGSTLPYREAVEEVERYRFFTPAAARVTDPRERILPGDRATVDRLLAFIENADTQIRALLGGKPGKGDEWLTEKNENIQTVLRLMTEFVMDVRNSGIILRFDQPAAGNVVARYDEGDNLLHVRAVATDNDLRIVLPSLLHEYAHAKQDRRAAELVVGGRAPIEHTREAELAKETEARLVDVYAAQLLNRAKLGPSGGAALDAVLGSVGFRIDFERMRTGSRKERKEATKAIRERLEGPYETQLAANAPAAHYPIEITQSNTATLFRRGPTGGGEPVDLGPIPQNVTTRDQLADHLAAAMRARPWFGTLFTRAAGGNFVVATFYVFFRDVNGRDQVVAEFNLGPPPVPAAVPAPPAVLPLPRGGLIPP